MEMRSPFLNKPNTHDGAVLRAVRMAWQTVRYGIVLLVALSLAVSATATTRVVPRPGGPTTTLSADGVSKGGDTRPLKIGERLTRVTQGCDRQLYKIVLSAGQFMQVIIEEHGAEVIATLFDPGGDQIMKAGIPGFFNAHQKVVPVVASRSGAYLLEVGPANPHCKLQRVSEQPQRYEIRIAELRPALPQDAGRVAAEKLFLQGQELVARNSPETRAGALEKYEEALRLWHVAGDANGEARVLTAMGWMHIWILHRSEKAHGYYDRALALSRASGDRVAEARLLNTLAKLYTMERKVDKAFDYYTQALSIWRKLGDRREELGIITGFAFMEQARANAVPRWDEYAERGLTLSRALGDRYAEVEMLLGLSGHYEKAGERRKALDHLHKVVSIFSEVKDSYRELDVRNRVGLLYAAAGEKQRALDYLNQTLKLSRSVTDPQMQAEARTLNNIAYIHNSSGEYREALTYLLQALRINRSLSERLNEAATLNNIGYTYSELSSPPQALEYLRQALWLYREAGDFVGEGDTLSNMMTAGQSLEAPRLAIFYGKQAVNAFQRYRAIYLRQFAKEREQRFIKAKAEIYHRLADLLVEAGRLAEAQQVLGLLKNEEYSEFLRGDDTAPQGQADLTAQEAVWERRYREIADRVTALGRERGELLKKKARTRDEERRLAKLEEDLAAAGEAFQRVLSQLAAEFEGTRQTAKVEQLRESQGMMEDLRELGPGAVAIYTILGGEKYRAILVTPDVQKAFEYPIKAAELNRKVLAFREALQDRKRDPVPLAQELYRIIVGPLAKDLEQARAETLMWSLDGVLRYLPTAALHDGQNYLVERYRNVIFTLASQPRLKDLPSRKWTGLGLGVSKARGGLQSLPSVPEELRGIIRQQAAAAPGEGVLFGKVMLDEDFTEETMRAELRHRYSLVHIASHFRFQPGNEMNSFLLLGDGSHLTLAEIRRSQNLFGGAELLTLSACNTATGGVDADGKEVEGFGVLAQRQGAKAVVASLWDVSDKSTRLLMLRFYQARESHPGMTKAEALRRAQLSLLHGVGNSEFEAGAGVASPAVPGVSPPAPRHGGTARASFTHPFYWAAFTMIGNWK